MEKYGKTVIPRSVPYSCDRNKHGKNDKIGHGKYVGNILINHWIWDDLLFTAHVDYPKLIRKPTGKARLLGEHFPWVELWVVGPRASNDLSRYTTDVLLVTDVSWSPPMLVAYIPTCLLRIWIKLGRPTVGRMLNPGNC